MLDDASKKLLTNFVLKTRLTENSNIRLTKTYNNNTELISKLKIHFITKKSISTLLNQLYNTKRKSIENFGKSLEELLMNLTIRQANGDEN